MGTLDIKDLILLLLRDNLRIETNHVDGRVEIAIKFAGEVIDKDFIDYSDVVRVVYEKERH